MPWLLLLVCLEKPVISSHLLENQGRPDKKMFSSSRSSISSCIWHNIPSYVYARHWTKTPTYLGSIHSGKLICWFSIFERKNPKRFGLWVTEWLDWLLTYMKVLPHTKEKCSMRLWNKQGARGHRPFQAPLIHKTQKTINMKKKKILNEKWSQWLREIYHKTRFFWCCGKIMWFFSRLFMNSCLSQQFIAE